MAYSQDLRQRVLFFVHGGGSKAEASRRYEINVDTVYEWLKQSPNHQAKRPGPKGSRKLSRIELVEVVEAQPDLMLKELAARFGVGTSLISKTLRMMGIHRKKNTAIRTGVHPSQHPKTPTLSET